jgi:hypothetical protein
LPGRFTRRYFDLTDPDGRAWEVRWYQHSQGGSGLSETSDQESVSSLEYLAVRPNRA